MSKFFSKKHKDLVAYVPGEQPKNRAYVKLNTNESPFPPSPKARRALKGKASALNLYCDPENGVLCKAIALRYGVDEKCVVAGNGSDDVLNFAVSAFCDKDTPLVFADVTYGFYPVFAKINGVPTTILPLKEDFTLPVDEFCSAKGTIVIANPNAPTGIFLPLDEVEKIVKSDLERVVIVDEAYVDFGGESAVKLVAKYDNLLVVQTFSKSRSLAGARIGFGIGNESLIRDLNTIRYSLNPYNVNALSQVAGASSMADERYFQNAIKTIIENRDYTASALTARGYEVLPSKANFLFVKSPKTGGEALYLALKDEGVLVRWFSKARIKEYLRVTIGTKKQMDAFLKAIDRIEGERV